MSRIPSMGPITRPESDQPAGNDLANVGVDTFLELMIAELQNQDPLDPIENSELVQQISQIREISATNKLTDTLDAIITGQNLASASSLIGQTVSALSDDGSSVEGLVDRVSIEVSDDHHGQRTIKVHIDDQSIALENIREVIAS